MRKAIAIDFDGCLCEWSWPEIGAPHMDVIKAAIQEKKNGAGLILWTCRIGERLDEAVKFCEDLGLTFDTVNANLPERIAAYQNDCRKVFADEYWDDKAIRMGASCEAGRRAVYKDALNTWGAEAQTKMLFEEIGELMQAVCKAGRVKNWEQRMEVWHNIAEEIADVSIMLGQMAVLFDVEDSVENCKQEKIERLVKRLEEAHAKEAGHG